MKLANTTREAGSTSTTTETMAALGRFGAKACSWIMMSGCTFLMMSGGGRPTRVEDRVRIVMGGLFVRGPLRKSIFMLWLGL